ncbi:MAG: hypothetical protein IH621_18905 [Krumholzibacteria bacterium]|nr:hypothetical protein [Candidatus Krumholzibacteria bacterium]
MLRRSAFAWLVPFVMALVATSAVASGVVSNAGAGAGLNYGGLGLNVARAFGAHFAAVAGAGYFSDGRPGWGAGVQVHAPLATPTVLARASVLFGTMRSLHASRASGGAFEELDHGYSVGPGLLARIGARWWIAGDVFYKVTDPPAGYTDGGSRLCGALGVVYGGW